MLHILDRAHCWKAGLRGFQFICTLRSSVSVYWRFPLYHLDCRLSTQVLGSAGIPHATSTSYSASEAGAKHKCVVY